MKNIILSEQQQQELIESIKESVSEYFKIPSELKNPSQPFTITLQARDYGKIYAHLQNTLKTLQNEVIQAYNEALDLSSMNLSLNLDRDYMYFKGKSEAYKKVINLIQNKLQNIEKEI